jgi:DNA-binding GntR family transcriptional regulator
MKIGAGKGKAMSSRQHSSRPVRLTRIARRRVSDDVYAQIRSAILERQFLPGERLSIPDLAARFDVSQMPVRQAIGRLNDEGLVEVRPRSGTFVAEVDERDIADTFDIRRALERLAAETAVGNAKDKDIADLDDLVRRMDATFGERNDPEGHDRLNSEFHRRIIRLSSNQKLLEMYDQLNAHLKIARVHLSSHDWSTRVEREQVEHREIVDALRRRDADMLDEALSRHISRSKQALTGDIRDALRGARTAKTA